MSIAEIERFAGDLKVVDALRAAAEKQAGESQAAALQALITFASSKGYAFTSDELKEYAKSAHAKGTPLTDAQLEGISGGNTEGAYLAFGFAVFFGQISNSVAKHEKDRAER